VTSFLTSSAGLSSENLRCVFLLLVFLVGLSAIGKLSLVDLAGGLTNCLLSFCSITVLRVDLVFGNSTVFLSSSIFLLSFLSTPALRVERVDLLGNTSRSTGGGEGVGAGDGDLVGGEATSSELLDFFIILRLLDLVGVRGVGSTAFSWSVDSAEVCFCLTLLLDRAAGTGC